MSEENKALCAVNWYRCRLAPGDMKSLHQRSDWKGLLQTLSYLGLLVVTGTAAYFAVGRLPWFAVAALLFLHGTVFDFMGNGVHELGHGTVFKTKWLNELFVRILSFFSWWNFEMFGESHIRHHRYTLHPPGDLEVVLPLHIMVREFFLQGFLNFPTLYKTLKDAIRLARGRLRGEWEEMLFPESDPQKRSRPVNWARFTLMGHALIIIVSCAFHLWMIPVLTTLAPFYGSWLFFLCNNTQHIGLQDNVPDFRLCCRTFTMSPVVQFLYWHMNYHIEHHMYAAVPCYNLGGLHRLIKHDLPPCAHGLVATWSEIAMIQRIQKTNPSYQHVAIVPGMPAKPVSEGAVVALS